MTEDQKKALTEILLKRISHIDVDQDPKNINALLAISAGINALAQLNTK